MPSDRSDLPRLLTSRGAARVLNCHPDTVRRWCRNGRLDARRIGETWRVPRSEILRPDGSVRSEIAPMDAAA